jgi:hypothetical protein
MKDRVPSLYNDHWWHSFRSQVPGLIHTRSCRKRETEFDRTVTPAVDCWCHCLPGGDGWKWMNCEREEEGQSRDLSMIMIKKKGWTIHDKTNVKESHERQRDHTCRCMNNRYARQSLKWHSFRSQVPVLIHMRSCIISTPNRVSSLDVYSVSLVNKSLMNKYSCMTLTHPWHSCMTHHDQSFVFECQVFQMSQVCPVFQSRSLCQDFYIHRLAPLVSHSKNKKADFLQVCTQFSIVLLDV